VDAAEGAFALGFAAGALLVMLSDTLMPEAFALGGREAGLLTLRRIKPPSNGKRSMPSHSRRRPSRSVAVAVHSLTTRPSRTYMRLPRKLRSGQFSKIRAMCPGTSSPSIRSPAVWFSKTIPGACSATIAATSWAFQASL
jgi:hypothetical protein